MELSPCAPAIISSQPPSSTCCAKLNKHKPCLYGYLNDPNLKPYINSPNAKNVYKTSGVPTPKCEDRVSHASLLAHGFFRLYVGVAPHFIVMLCD
ncbi:hypothetical protein H5410_014203 [Solanum commersonii]|uniref:Bifunctional inhibitor/plant lipid transfer protein/seed storage helical domain-containing protein n=1 Tax=Solanum commersonii TaxID=4109 RepID=A0A9J5ZQK1_SOLCO|nr:hypothetical protein H5410_014203 [Solanum commersonii]